jgi:hypothetical protein
MIYTSVNISRVEQLGITYRLTWTHHPMLIFYISVDSEKSRRLMSIPQVMQFDVDQRKMELMQFFKLVIAED